MRKAAALFFLALAFGCGRTEPYDLNIPRARLPDGGMLPSSDGGGATDAGPDAGPGPQCVIELSPTTIDFGKVPLGTTVTVDVTVFNVGDAGCTVGDDVISTTAPLGEFQRVPLPLGGTFLAPGADAGILIPVSFTATDKAPPHQRTGTLTVSELSPTPTSFAVALAATIEVGCELQASPQPVDFGNVPLNTNATAALTLTNSGDEPCDISQVSLDPTGSPLFSLVNPTTIPFEVAAGGTGSIPLAFSGNDSAAPHQRQTNLNFTVTQPVGLPAMAPQSESVVVQAYINTACLVGSQWIYTLDQVGLLSTFDPRTLSFTDLGFLNCPVTDPLATPFSMAVDQSAIAWVEYVDTSLTGPLSGNQALFRVDPATLQCTATSFQPDPNLDDFGMGFVFDPATGIDTLYVSGMTNAAFNSTNPLDKPSTLATISFPSLALTPVGPIALGAPELTGTGDGQLWGFAPARESTRQADTVAQLDPATGNALVTYTYGSLGTGGYAVKFWGGSLWIFVGSTVWQVDRTNGSLSEAIANTGRVIVGAGVSTCAPLQ